MKKLRLIIMRLLLAPLPRTRKLRFYMWQNGKGFQKALSEARARKADRDEIGKLYSEWGDEYRMLQDEYEAIYSRRLVNKAIRLRVPVPDRSYSSEDGEDEHWEHSQYTGESHLKPEGIRKVRAEIRNERKARNELFLPWITLLIGLVGALTGLMAVILR